MQSPNQNGEEFWFVYFAHKPKVHNISTIWANPCQTESIRSYNTKGRSSQFNPKILTASVSLLKKKLIYVYVDAQEEFSIESGWSHFSLVMKFLYPEVV